MKSFCTSLCAAFAAALLLVSCGGNNDIGLLAFNTTLTGREQVPPNQSGAFGTGIVTVDLDNGAVIASVVNSGLADTAVQLHAAPIGSSGPLVFPLSRTAGSTAWVGSGTLTDAQLATLRAGNYYLDARSAAFPNGELRGQLIEQFPSDEQLLRLRQASAQSPLIERQLRQVRRIEDADGGFTGIGVGLGFGF